jgi:hypothetical protein
VCANIVFVTGGELAFNAAVSDERAGEEVAHWRHMLARPWTWVGIVCSVFEIVA